MRLLIGLALVFASPAWAAERVIDVPIGSAKFRLVGKLHEPLGTVVTLQGVVVDGPSKGYEGGPNLRVQRINGRATQEHIQIVLAPYFNKFGEKAFFGEPLPKLEFGKTYEFEGFETGEFLGVPEEAYKRAGIALQTAIGPYFLHRLVVYKGKQIEPIIWSPADLEGRIALIEGRAESRDGKAYIVGAEWRLLTDASAPWQRECEGKTVAGHGTIRKGDEAKQFRLESGTARLVKLTDQVGRPVTLRGTAWSLNGHWWFNYRGTDMYVDGMKDLPGVSERHGMAIVISGVLEEAGLPALDQISLKSDRDVRKYFIVRKASWKPLEALLSPER